MRKPVNVTWEDRPEQRIVSIEWDCGCHIFSDAPGSNVICLEHIGRDAKEADFVEAFR